MLLPVVLFYEFIIKKTMSNTWRDYRGFKITTNKTYEETRDRIARGSTEAVVVGYYFYIWRSAGKGEPFRRVRELIPIDCPTEAEAVIKAQDAIDKILSESVEPAQ